MKKWAYQHTPGCGKTAFYYYEDDIWWGALIRSKQAESINGDPIPAHTKMQCGSCHKPIRHGPNLNIHNLVPVKQ